MGDAAKAVAAGDGGGGAQGPPTPLATGGRSNKCVQIALALVAVIIAALGSGQTGQMGEEGGGLVQDIFQLVAQAAGGQLPIEGASIPEHFYPSSPPLQVESELSESHKKRKKKKKHKKGSGGNGGGSEEIEAEESSSHMEEDDGGWEVVGGGTSESAQEAHGGYYKQFSPDASGQQLKQQLHKLVSQHKVLEYSTVWDALEEMDNGDKTGCQSGHVRDIYTGKCWMQRRGRCGAGEQHSAGACYNREHTWPQSWWGGASEGLPSTTDVVHLYLADGYVNRLRGNLPLGDVVAKADYTSANGARIGTCKGFKQAGSSGNGGGWVTGTVKFFNEEKGFGFVQRDSGTGGDVFLHRDHVQGGTKLFPGDYVEMKVVPAKKGDAGRQASKVMRCFEPPAEYKGDLSRVYFYMSVRYLGVFKCCSHNGVEGSAIHRWMEDELRVWHAADPVSKKEQSRNNMIHRWQGNRNPFVDMPDLVAKISDF